MDTHALASQNPAPSKKIRPFLKWVGGKRWLTSYSNLVVPQQFGTYIEPFLGGGAMFFKIQPERAILADVNSDLVNCYSQVKANWSGVWEGLIKEAEKHSKEYYYLIRAQETDYPLRQAIRFLYLNRTCFNGIYRVNKNGKFNVPIGDKTRLFYDYDDFESISNALSKTELLSFDFEKTISKAERGDFIYCDPPYTVAHNNNGFIKYNENLFSWSDQVRLRNSLADAHKRGALFLVSNANHYAVKELYYSSDYHIENISRVSVIGSKNDYRGVYSEILISNYPISLYS